MLGLVGATVSVMSFTYLVVLFECLLHSVMCDLFTLLAFQQIKKERKKHTV